MEIQISSCDLQELPAWPAVSRIRAKFWVASYILRNPRVCNMPVSVDDFGRWSRPQLGGCGKIVKRCDEVVR